MTTAEPGSPRDPSWTDPSSWSAAVGAAGSAIREDVDALLDRLAGPREVTAQWVDAPAAPADHDLDDVAVPTPPSPIDDGEPDFGRGATGDAAPVPVDVPGRSSGGGGSGDDGRPDERGATNDSDDDAGDSGHDGDGSWPHGTQEDRHDDDGSGHDGGHDTAHEHDPGSEHDLGDHAG
ncbi:hypothetical protein GCM10023201_34480 [Actinomycetospora corticicola]|uniref:Uncharacterized protein n=1 Tax=Actinomycetospora corticicola TaxID=663602 RepID=A0A7Y9E0T4_9PSEU|nr:hypothetical protein [Actinomycetospora corticicola]NYD38840.1 hypothetical protein [Actinomycetospora corticicola]